MPGLTRPPTIRALVTDVDGTLTDAERRLDLEAATLVRRMERSGIRVILATGNVLPSALAIHRSLGLSGPIVAENGGLLYRRVNDHEKVTVLADVRLARRAYRRIRRAGIPARRLFTDRWRTSEIALYPTVSVRRLADCVKGLNVRVESTGFAIHLIERTAGKLPALHRALRPLGLTLADCLVAGDGDNDVEMLRAAGWGVSFRTASPAARRAADYVARARSARGFVEAVKALNLPLHSQKA
ncbi:MAG: phosphoglycolate phosphatase [Thermoplasmata archaeon]